MIVLDAMIVSYALIEVPKFTGDVNRALRKDSACTSPPLWRSEVRNTLLQYVRSQDENIPGTDLELGDALRKMEKAERLLAGRTFKVETEEVMRVAERSGLSGYDSEYVALAHDLGVPLLTADRAVLEAFPETAVHPKDF